MSSENPKKLKGKMAGMDATRQITSSLQAIATMKLKKAQEATLRSRPLAQAIDRVVTTVVQRSGVAHPLYQERPVHTVLLFAIGSNRGLCGDFNASITRKIDTFIANNHLRYRRIAVAIAGSRMIESLHLPSWDIVHNFSDALEELEYNRTVGITRTMADGFLAGRIDQVILVYNGFKSAIRQEVVMEPLLPAGAPEYLPPRQRAKLVDFIFEPDHEEVLNQLLPRHLALQVHQALLESTAAEQSARMLAMSTASRNAGRLREEITRRFHRARQQAVTRDIIEVIGSARAVEEMEE